MYRHTEEFQRIFQNPAEYSDCVIDKNDKEGSIRMALQDIDRAKSAIVFTSNYFRDEYWETVFNRLSERRELSLFFIGGKKLINAQENRILKSAEKEKLIHLLVCEQEPDLGVRLVDQSYAYLTEITDDLKDRKYIWGSNPACIGLAQACISDYKNDSYPYLRPATISTSEIDLMHHALSAHVQ